MADSTTNLDLIVSSQSNKEVTANGLIDALSPASIFGRRAQSSSGLTFGYYGGRLMVAGVSTLIANGTVLLTVSAINYIQANSAGLVSINTVGFTTGFIQIFKVIVGATAITSYEDLRTTTSIGGEGNPIPVAYKRKTVTYAAVVSINCSAESIFDITLTGNITIGFTSPAYDGQKIILRVKQDAIGSRIVAFDSTIKVGTDITGFTATTTAAKTDVLGFIYNAQSDKFDLVAITKGY